MRRRRISEEEAGLWRRAVRDVKPLGRGFSLTEPAASPKKAVYGAPPLADRHPTRSAPTIPPHFVFGGGDPGADRRAATRRLPIDRTLDLHGMTQVEAHRALLSLIASARGEGLRLLLVITGKGRAPDFRPGILKSRFLDWVEAPPLRSEIARVAPAKAKDGGAGAFYVYLKAKCAGHPPRR